MCWKNLTLGVLAIFYMNIAQSQTISLISGSYSSATATGTGAGGNASLSYTAPAGTDRLLVFAMAIERDHKPNPTGDNWANPAVLGGSTTTVTYGGVAMTLLGWSIAYWANVPVSETTTNISTELLVFGMAEASIPAGVNSFAISGNFNNGTNAGDESIFAAMTFENVSSASNQAHNSCGACVTLSTSAVDPVNANNAIVSIASIGSPRTYTEGAGYTQIGTTTIANANGTYTSASLSEKDGSAIGAQYITGTTSTQTSPYTVSGSTNLFGTSQIVLRMVATSTLPVEFVGFHAEKNKSNVELAWSTASEYNSSHFIIERSKDGMEFDSIASTSAQGFKNDYTQYNYTDKNPGAGYIYYRLKEVDMDGKTATYDIQNVYMEEKEKSVSVFPNPCINCNSFSVNYNMSDVKQIVISDMFGKMVEQEVFVSYAPGGAMKLDFPKKFEKGIYNITIQTTDGMVTEKLVVE
jgi:hypothetical protein